VVYINPQQTTKTNIMTETSTNSDTFLIQNCINGDRRSQKAMYEQFAPKMFAICLKYVKNQMDAEDVLQDGFVKLFNNLHKFRGEGSFDGWVRRIFVNSAIEQLRKRNPNITETEGLENKIKDKQCNALDGLYEKDLINTSMKLSEGYRTVFNLYAVEGFSHKEIGQKLGITESTSKSQFSRAKAILRNVIEHKATASRLKEAV